MRAIPVFVLGLLIPTLACGQSPDHELRIGDVSVPVGSLAMLPVTYTNTSGVGTAGWTFGVEHDWNELWLVDVQPGAALAGLTPDFSQLDLWAAGWTVSVVLSLTGAVTLPPGSDQELYVASYESSVSCGESTTVSISDTLGFPTVSPSVTLADGTTVVPTQVAGTVVPSGFDFNYIAPELTVESGGTVTALFAISEESGASSTQGFSMGLAHDPALFQVETVETYGVLAGLSGGIGPDYFGDFVFPEGWAVGVVYSFGAVFLQFPAPGEEVLAVTYTNIGGTPGERSDLDWTDGLGDPPVSNIVVVSGQSYPACGQGGGLTVFVSGFTRGDANGDGTLEIADAIVTLEYLFVPPGGSILCLDALDTNDDGTLDLGDPISSLIYLFAFGAPPPDPFPSCGTDPTDDALDCADPGACP